MSETLQQRRQCLVSCDDMAGRSGKPRLDAKSRAREVSLRLACEYPGSAAQLCALEHSDAFQLLVATILSAQCRDERVNQVTPALFARYGTPDAMAGADRDTLEDLIRSTGFFKNKTSSLIGMAQRLTREYHGEVPSAIEDLVTLPGVGRKTANVVRSVFFCEPGLPVDTHVGRVSRRLGLTSEVDPPKVESALCAMIPPEETGVFSLRVILHGRRICRSRSPRCVECSLADICEFAEQIGAEPLSKTSGRCSVGGDSD
ncbi:MAG: endonuclease III [Acidimicrobiales bacterium]